MLFGSVQITMVLLSIYAGDHLGVRKWLGLMIAFMGLAYLFLAGAEDVNLKISPVGLFLMVLSGVAWALYTLLGRSSQNPLQDTAYNFIKTLPWLVVLLAVYFYRPITITAEGVLLSLSAGVITSGLGYAIWYTALQGLSRIQASVVQLLVPVVAAFGGIVFLQEAVTQTLILSMCVVLGGAFLVIYSPNQTKKMC